MNTVEKEVMSHPPLRFGQPIVFGMEKKPMQSILSKGPANNTKEEQN